MDSVSQDKKTNLKIIDEIDPRGYLCIAHWKIMKEKKVKVDQSLMNIECFSFKHVGTFSQYAENIIRFSFYYNY